MDRSRAADRYKPARKAARRIVFISGDNTRTFTVSPILAGVAALLGAVVTVGFLGATGYLMFRDDLMNTVVARNATMQQAYEDRIAALRSEIDRIASRQILDQVAFDEKVDRLLAAQRNLGDRQRVVTDLIERAKASGILAAGDPARDDRAAVDPIETGTTTAYAADGRTAEIERRFAALTEGPAALPADRTAIDKRPSVDLVSADGKPDLKAIADDLAGLQAEQTETVRAIASATEARADKVARIVSRLGVTLRDDKAAAAANQTATVDVGGPYLSLDSAEALRAALYEADAAFGRLSNMKKAVGRLPVGEPVKGAQRTSNFGSRTDPFLGSAAFHAGIDFRSPVGRPVEATAAGIVTEAGRNGGYGLMVEVDHGGGLTTRYAHLSALKVRPGERIERGDVVGLVGSTGRSTGPHLHYETRVDGTAVNPVLYLNAGDEIAHLLH